MAEETEEEKKKRERDEKLKKDSRIRLSEQAILMLAAGQLVKKKIYAGTATTLPAKSEQVHKNFCTFRGSDVSGGHIALTKKIFKTPDIAYIIKKVPNNVLSSLVPSVKLYKIFYPQASSKGVSWRIPFDDASVKINNLTSEYQENVLDEIREGGGRMHGVGIKSFTYRYKGTNPAEVNANIEVELELIFQDVRDLVKEISINSSHPNFENAKIASEEMKSFDVVDEKEKVTKGKLSFSYTDLVADVASKVDKKNATNKDKQHNEKYYRIKAVIGYSMPSDTILSNFLKPDEIKTFKSAIKACNVMLYLNPHNHDISFEENGMVSIKIQYIGAITAILASLNILEIATTYYAELNAKKEELEKFTQNNENEVKKIKRNCAGKTAESVKAEVEQEYKKIKEQMEKKKQLLEESKNKLYSEIFNRIVGVTGDAGFLYEMAVKKSSIGLEDDATAKADAEKATTDEQKKAAAANQRIQNLELYKQVFWQGDPGSHLSKPPAGGTPPTSSDGTNSTSASDATRNSIGKAEAEALREKMRSEGDKVFIKFVFLGDLMDLFSEVIDTVSSASEKPRIILTDFNIELPYFEEGNFKTKQETLNIADIPISLDMLKFFLLERVVKPRISAYPLLSVINNIFSDIISPAMTPTFFGNKSVLNRNIRISNCMFTIPCTDAGKDIITGLDFEKAKFAGALTDASITDGIVNSIYDSYMTNVVGNYLIMYCSNQLPNLIYNNKGNQEADEKDGIFHFLIGSDTGFIKKISFSKQQTPFYKEAKNASSQGVESLGRLREVYDVSVNMFGNNIYRPGDYFYVKPMVYAGKSVIDLENKIGLGGFYQVIDVENRINENIFETSINGTLYGHIEEGKVLEEQKAGDCE